MRIVEEVAEGLEQTPGVRQDCWRPMNDAERLLVACAVARERSHTSHKADFWIVYRMTPAAGERGMPYYHVLSSDTFSAEPKSFVGGWTGIAAAAFRRGQKIWR